VRNIVEDATKILFLNCAERCHWFNNPSHLNPDPSFTPDLGGGKVQQWLGNFVSWRRTESVQKQYEGKWARHCASVLSELCSVADDQVFYEQKSEGARFVNGPTSKELKWQSVWTRNDQNLPRTRHTLAFDTQTR
jgi:hypothetical protein